MTRLFSTPDGAKARIIPPMKSSRLLALIATVLLGAASLAEAQAIQALGIFEQRCGTCHTKPAADSRAPDRDSLRQRTPEAVLDALTTGSMKINAEGLTDTQKRMIAEYITERPLGAALAGQASAMPNQCAAKALGNPLAGPAWNGGEPYGFTPRGATGVMVRTLVTLLEGMSTADAGG